MKYLTIFINLILSILALEEIPDQCDYISTVNMVKNLSDCQQIIKNDPENQCCLGVQYMLGKKRYFCHKFSKSASQSEVDDIMDEYYVKNVLEQYFGLIVKAKGSCVNEVKPFGGNKCSIEDTQNVSDNGIQNCTSNVRYNNSNYCCLFTGKVLDTIGKDKNVQFCNELSKEQVEDMIGEELRIEIGTEMESVKNLFCIPEEKQEQEEKLELEEDKNKSKEKYKEKSKEKSKGKNTII